MSAIPFIPLVFLCDLPPLDFRNFIDKIRPGLEGASFAFFAFQDKKCFEIKDGVPYHLENLRTVFVLSKHFATNNEARGTDCHGAELGLRNGIQRTPF